MNSKLLVISPHPDDETLGAGGTILRYKDQGYQVAWFNFTDMTLEYGYQSVQISKRTQEIEHVRKSYGIDAFYNLRLKPAGLDSYPINDLVKKTTAIIQEIQPDTVILPFKNDVHSDHRIVFETVYSCTKIFRFPFIRRIFSMEILSETDFASSDNRFIPNYYMDISSFLEKKIEIIKLYGNEIKQHPFPRSVESIAALATIRGATAGCQYAEGFMLLKGIE